MQEFQYMAMQLRLQREMGRVNPDLGKTDPFEMTPDELANFITWNMTACIKELSEATDEVGWKPWASSRHVNYPECIFEMVDAWHFFMNMMLGMAAMAGVTVDQAALAFESYYVKKNAKNLQRQVEGYDGVSDKCGYCQRDLTEIRQADRLGMFMVDGLKFCSEEHASLHEERTRSHG